MLAASSSSSLACCRTSRLPSCHLALSRRNPSISHDASASPSYSPTSSSLRGAPLQAVVVESSVTLAVTQQTIAYAAILAAECGWTRAQPRDSDDGLPGLLPVGLAVVAVLGVLTLVGSGDTSTEGYILGLTASAFMLVYNAKRINDTPYDGATWPGQKAWPSVMALISFFSCSLYIQALAAEI